MKFWQAHKKILLILGLAFILIFWRISHVDLVGDDGHYSFRALGLVDFLLSDAQTTPVDWYDHLPAWSYLSFHDHPLIIFLIQHLFLSISTSGFWLHLPFALFGLGTIWLMYVWIKEQFGETPALISALTLTVMADFITLSRRPLMEIGVMFFIVLALYYFSLFIKNNRQWLNFGICLGLLVEVKFTTVFVFLTILVHLLITKVWREKLFLKKFLAALGISGLLALPVIIYNVAMFIDRGHPSYQFARIFKTNSPWNAGGFTLTSTGSNFLASFEHLGQWISWPAVILFIVSFVYLLAIKQGKKYSLLLLLPVLFFIEDAFIGAHDLYPITITPVIGVAISELWSRVKKPEIVQYAAWTMFSFLLLYTINSNIFAKNFGTVGWLRSSRQPQNYGLAQLDSYLTELSAQAKSEKNLDILDVYPEIKLKESHLRKYMLPGKTLADEGEKLQTVILYDNSLNWFPRFWVFARRLFYNNEIYLSTKTIKPISKTLGYSPRVSYFIKAKNTLLESDQTESQNAQQFEDNITQAGIKAVKIIYRDDGLEAFRIYKLPDNVRFKFE